MELTWNFRRGGGGFIGQIPSVGGRGMDIFWNHTLEMLLGQVSKYYALLHILCSTIILGIFFFSYEQTRVRLKDKSWPIEKKKKAMKLFRLATSLRL